MFHGRNGVNDAYKAVGVRYAEEGIVAMAVNYFTQSNSPTNVESVQTIEAALALLSKEPSVDSSQVVMSGYCKGGGLTYLGLANVSEFAAGVVYHGGLFVQEKSDGFPESPADAALRYLLTGGDALTRRPAPDLGFAVVNNYGLSETAVVATSGVVAPDGEGLPSIGRPIAGVVAEVVDEDLQPVEPGADGELVIAGVAVARGYLHRPELTAERFTEDEQGRRYRTGDRVAWRSSGGGSVGRVERKLTSPGMIKGHEIAASRDNPEFLVRSDKSGKVAAHKPSALRRVK